LFPFFAVCPEKLFFKRKNGKKESPKRVPGKLLPKGNGISAAGWKSLETTSFYHYAVVFWLLV